MATFRMYVNSSKNGDNESSFFSSLFSVQGNDGDADYFYGKVSTKYFWELVTKKQLQQLVEKYPNEFLAIILARVSHYDDDSLRKIMGKLSLEANKLVGFKALCGDLGL